MAVDFEPAVDVTANPLVSIIVPSYNQGRFIRRTLDSILSQDYRPLEVFVVDGASTDETVSILREYSCHPELQWVSERDSGVVEAVNKGFAKARGEFAASRTEAAVANTVESELVSAYQELTKEMERLLRQPQARTTPRVAER